MLGTKTHATPSGHPRVPVCGCASVMGYGLAAQVLYMLDHHGIPDYYTSFSGWKENFGLWPQHVPTAPTRQNGAR